MAGNVVDVVSMIIERGWRAGEFIHKRGVGWKEG